MVYAVYLRDGMVMIIYCVDHEKGDYIGSLVDAYVTKSEALARLYHIARGGVPIHPDTSDLTNLPEREA